MAKVLVLLNAGPEDLTRVESALGFANMLQRSPDSNQVALIFFGNAVELLRQPEYMDRASEFIEKGTFTLACQAHAEKKQIKDELSEGKVTLKYVGEDIVRLINEGYQVVSF